MDGRKKKLPCLVGSCNFQGSKLKRHLMSKYHSFGEKETGLKESFLNHRIKHLCEISKHIRVKPVICRKCSICVDRMDIHLNHRHQMHHRCDALYKEIDKCKKFTMEYEKKLFPSKSNISDNNDEQTEKQP